MAAIIALTAANSDCLWSLNLAEPKRLDERGRVWYNRRMIRFITFTFWLLAGAALAQDAVESVAGMEQGALPVFREPPPSYTTIDKVSASSRDYSGRTRSGKESYVIREMQRQVRALGGNALLITQMNQIDQVEPVYGSSRGSLEYRKIPQFYGAGEAIVVPGNILPAASSDPVPQ